MSAAKPIKNFCQHYHLRAYTCEECRLCFRRQTSSTEEKKRTIDQSKAVETFSTLRSCASGLKILASVWVLVMLVILISTIKKVFTNLPYRNNNIFCSFLELYHQTILSTGNLQWLKRWTNIFKMLILFNLLLLTYTNNGQRWNLETQQHALIGTLATLSTISDTLQWNL